MEKLTIFRFLLPLFISLYGIGFAFGSLEKRADEGNGHQNNNEKHWHLKATTDQKEAIVNVILTPPFEEIQLSASQKSNSLPFLDLFHGKQKDQSQKLLFRLSPAQKEAVFAGVVESLSAWAGENSERRLEAENLLQNAVDFDQILRVMFDQDFKPVEHWTKKKGYSVDKALESVQSEAFHREQLQHAVSVLVRNLREINGRFRVPLMTLIRAVLRGRLPKEWEHPRKEAMARELYAQVLRDTVGKFESASMLRKDSEKLHQALRGSQQIRLYSSIAQQTPEALHVLCIPRVEAVLRRDGLNEIRTNEDLDKVSEVIHAQSLFFLFLPAQLREEVFEWALEHYSLKKQNNPIIEQERKKALNEFGSVLLQAFFSRVQAIGGARGEAIAKELADELLHGKKEKLAADFASKLQQSQRKNRRNYRFADYTEIPAIVEDVIELFDGPITQRAEIRQRFGSENIGELVDVFLAQKTPEDKERLFTELLALQQSDQALFREYVHSKQQKNTSPEAIHALQTLAKTDLSRSGFPPGEAGKLKFAVFKHLFFADGREKKGPPPVEAACQALTLVSSKLREKVLYPKEEIDGRSRSQSKFRRDLNAYHEADVVEIQALLVVGAVRMFRGDIALTASPGKFLENVKTLFAAFDVAVDGIESRGSVYDHRRMLGEWFTALWSLNLEGDTALGITKRFLLQLLEANNWRKKHNLELWQYLGDFANDIPGRSGISSLMWLLPDDNQKLRNSVLNKIAHILKKNPKLRVSALDQLLQKLPYGLGSAQIQATLEGKTHNEKDSEAAYAFLVNRVLPGWDEDTAMAVLNDIQRVLNGWYRELTPYSVKETNGIIDSTPEFSSELLSQFRAMYTKQRSDVFSALKKIKVKNGWRKAGNWLEEAHQHCHQQQLTENLSETSEKISTIQAQLKKWDTEGTSGGWFSWIRGESGDKGQPTESIDSSSSGHHPYSECLLERLLHALNTVE